MASIYEILKLPVEGLFIPTVSSDDEGWTKRLCRHKHRSEKEARKCLRKALPAYMKRLRRLRKE